MSHLQRLRWFFFFSWEGSVVIKELFFDESSSRMSPYLQWWALSEWDCWPGEWMLKGEQTGEVSIQTLTDGFFTFIRDHSQAPLSIAVWKHFAVCFFMVSSTFEEIFVTLHINPFSVCPGQHFLPAWAKVATSCNMDYSVTVQLIKCASRSVLKLQSLNKHDL